VYQQRTGITTVSKYVIAWDPIGWSVLPFRQQHHLCLITLTSGCQ